MIWPLSWPDLRPSKRNWNTATTSSWRGRWRPSTSNATTPSTCSTAASTTRPMRNRWCAASGCWAAWQSRMHGGRTRTS
ncbi:unnamed protein product [Ectocarpus sp. 12 AP-2014]